MVLYKYKSLSGDGLLHALDIIVNKRIYLANCDEMNDIKEGNYDIVKQSKESIDTAVKLQEKVGSIRFTSFTVESTDDLFWAHYADGFSGVAFEFNLKENNYDLREIKYDGKPTLSKQTMQDILNDKITAMDAGILVSKSKSWVDEQEYRLFNDPANPSPYVDIEPQKIIFGMKKIAEHDVLKEIAIKFDLQVSDLEYDKDGELEIYDLF